MGGGSVGLSVAGNEKMFGVRDGESVNSPELSMVVVVYNMAREAPRTLHSLSAEYQHGVVSDRYEVIVVDNGSEPPLGAAAVALHGPNFRYEYVSDAVVSPAAALNLGAARASGKWLGMMIDGARILTPGVVATALAACERHPSSLVETVGFHLGPDLKSYLARRRYDAAVEDELLARIGWPADGYRLFEIASLAVSSRRGWYGPLAESNCLFMSAADFHRHGGYDERFDAPGGGYVNLDFYRRTIEDPELTPVRLLGEASFHQVHGGAATGLHPVALTVKALRWRRQYRRIRGTTYQLPQRRPVFYGEVSRHAEPWMRASALLWPE